MTEAEAARCAAELALGLQHCHAQNVVHRDLSLSNVMFAEDGSAKLVDFGLAAICDDVATATFLEACGSAFFTPPVWECAYACLLASHVNWVWSIWIVIHRRCTQQSIRYRTADRPSMHGRSGLCCTTA
jgi:serine/threonine protein kinase